MISPRQVWRDFKRGWTASYHDYRTLPQIEKWKWHYWGEPPHRIPVHVLTGANDFLLAAWMLASWFHFSDHGWLVTIHDDGTLQREHRATLRALFPKCRFIHRDEADRVMHAALTPSPLYCDYRQKHPLSLKIFDMPHFAQNERFLVFDTHLLFFRKPNEVLKWVNDDHGNDCWFLEDVVEVTLFA